MVIVTGAWFFLHHHQWRRQQDTAEQENGKYVMIPWTPTLQTTVQHTQVNTQALTQSATQVYPSILGLTSTVSNSGYA